MTTQMTFAREQLKELIVSCRFEEVFMDHLGWGRYSGSIPNLEIGFAGEATKFKMSPVAQKRGFVVCRADCQAMPPKAVCQKLQRQFSLLHYEHLLIICDSENNQKWIAAIDRENKSRRPEEVNVFAGQSPNALLEKLIGLGFSLEEEGGLTITDVVKRTSEVFTQNAEQVTHKFYERFRKELKKLDNFIDGLRDEVGKEQYAALMMNRLMFIYFIQRKGYLDNDTDYLRNRLKVMQKKLGKDKYYKKFYRHFLIRLFHSGLGAPEDQRSKSVRKLIGKVPYLNGGLFDEHEIEKEYGKKINIPDKAFEELFKFFDRYNWHLDNRPTASGRDINPDVIGYIFEKFINYRAELGAYYTGEDITGYIARNTILPHLLQQTKNLCAEAFHLKTGTIWRLLRQNPDAYIYASVRHSCNKPNSELPPDIEQGLDHDKPNLLKRRKSWNKAADPEWALLGETWREVIARRSRYSALYKKIKDGGITDIADLVTYNLDIEKLAQNAISHHEGTDFLSAFFAAIAGRKIQESSNVKEQHGITVLDPACGSGAFLFAALKVLEPLYETCIDRMEEFVAENDAFREKRNTRKKKHEYFRSILDELSTHPNKKYWIYRSIILHNLFGVDIMPEATEVTKLRLFLKLAAEAEVDESKPNMGLEPLPDIDFNIRAGNGLVGFSSKEQFQQLTDLRSGPTAKIYTSAEKVGKAYCNFVDLQSSSGINKPKFKRAKNILQKHLKTLNDLLDKHLANVYGTDSDKRFSTWKQTHVPFHWFTEFYGIMESGGFDVVIGNPPYVQYNNALKEQYAIRKYQTESCRNLYAFFIERAKSLGFNTSPMGMIVPISALSTNRMSPLIGQLLNDSSMLHISSYATRPSQLFVDAEQRLSIFLSLPGKGVSKTAQYMKWNPEYRPHLFNTIEYENTISIEGVSTIPKIGNDMAMRIMKKILSNGKMHRFLGNRSAQATCHYYNAARYWTRATDYIPYYQKKGGDKQSALKTLHIDAASSLCALINSSLFHFWYETTSNCRTVNLREIQNFPLNLDVFHKSNKAKITKLVHDLMENFRTNTERKTINPPTGQVTYDEISPKYAKKIIDKIDAVFAKHYGFTDEELDYIINRDIRIRMSGAEE